MLLIFSYIAVASSATVFGYLLRVALSSNSTTDRVETKEAEGFRLQVITLPKSEYRRL